MIKGAPDVFRRAFPRVVFVVVALGFATVVVVAVSFAVPRGIALIGKVVVIIIVGWWWVGVGPTTPDVVLGTLIFVRFVVVAMVMVAVKVVAPTFAFPFCRAVHGGGHSGIVAWTIHFAFVARFGCGVVVVAALDVAEKAVTTALAFP